MNVTVETKFNGTNNTNAHKVSLVVLGIQLSFELILTDEVSKNTSAALDLLKQGLKVQLTQLGQELQDPKIFENVTFSFPVP